ncbi:MAG: carboxypeptidase-like regulatory domain-containing protein [Myxococcota bacterium]
MHFPRRLLVLAATFALAPDLGCSSTPPPPPPPPTVLRFQINDASTGMPIPMALLLLGPEDQHLVADAAGKVELEVSPGPHAYRADAPGYLAVPEAFAAKTIATAIMEQTVEVTIELEPRPAYAAGGTLSGKVTEAGVPVAGALVHASSTTELTTLTAADGTYLLLGVPANLYAVRAYVSGKKSSVRQNVSAVVGMETKDVDLTLTADPGATVGGTLGQGVGTTSVAITLAATGDPIPGAVVRASFGGNYSLTGVPEGSFVVRAGLEDDGVALNPDVIRTQMEPKIQITGTASASAALPMAAAVIGLQVTTSTGTVFHWSTFPGADFYVVEVRSITGQVLWGGFDARRSPRFRVRAPSTEVSYGDVVPPVEPLKKGQRYALHVYAGREVPQLSTFELLGQSEELKGRFRAAR